MADHGFPPPLAGEGQGGGRQRVVIVGAGFGGLACARKLEDATRLRNHVLTCLERADAEPDPEARRALLTFVVVGGGPTGVESSGALIELMEIVAGKDYHEISRAQIQVILVEGADRLLNAFSLRLGRYAQRVLTRRGVGVRTGA